MKSSIGIFFLVFIWSCTTPVKGQKYSDEKMYDRASTLKDLSQEIDGFIKFSDQENLNEDVLFRRFITNNSKILEAFKGFTIELNIDGDNAGLLLCDKDVALIEDAGCNARIDHIYWTSPKRNTCYFRMSLKSICQ